MDVNGGRIPRSPHHPEGLAKADLLAGREAFCEIGEVSVACIDAVSVPDQDLVSEPG